MKDSTLSVKEQLDLLNKEIKSLENSITLMRRELAKNPLDAEFLEKNIEESIAEKKEKVILINTTKRS